MPGFAVGDELPQLLFSHCKSNLLKTALYERELLLAANEEKERSMFERWRAALHGKRVQRVAPFPTGPRKDNNGENKATVYAKLYLNRESLCRRFGSFA